MPIRISGMNSGLDTESIISALVSNYKTKADTTKKAQTKLSWKQDAWKDVNKKVYSLYTGLDKVRRKSGFNLKKTTVSDPNKASVTATGTAITGTQTLAIKKLAATGYMTGNKLEKRKSDGSVSDQKVESSTKLSELGLEAVFDGEIEVGVGENKAKIKVGEDTTISEFVNSINNAKDADGNAIDIGVTASFDATSGRIFLSAKKSGAANDFTITGNDKAGQDALAKLGLGLDYASTSTIKNAALAQLNEDGTVDEDATRAKIQEAFSALNTTGAARKAAQDEYDKTSSYIEYAENLKNLRDHESTITAQLKKVKDQQGMEDVGDAWERIKTGTATKDDYTKFSKAMKDSRYASEAAAIKDLAGSDIDKAREISALEYQDSSSTDALSTYISDQKAANVANKKTLDEADAAYQTVRAQHEDFADLYELKSSDSEEAVDAALTTIKKAVSGRDSVPEEPVRIHGSDAEIELNGATFTGETNNFEINGLTINATGLTGENPISITTSVDSQGMYDKIKDWISDYNDVINELSKLYNADSSKGYEPLTDEEKGEMSETEIEKWEDKIKSSILRRDSTLDSIMNSMVNSLGKAFDITMKDGTTSKLSLASLGIQTAGYGVDKEVRYALHINGDAEDDEFSSKTDSLMAMINSDPDAVADLFSKVTQGLYDALDTKMKTSSMSSAYTIYNDKQMNTEYSNYTKQIKTWEDRRTDAEDKYYKQFAAMEKMLANINSSQSSLSGLMGG